MVWSWWNPGNVLAQIILPVMDVFTQSMHGLIDAIAQLTPGNWFLTVFNMMGGFVMTIGANSCTVVSDLARSVIDLWTHISPMQKTVGASVGVVCYFRDAVQSIWIAWISHKTEIVVAEVKSTVDLAAINATLKGAEIQNAARMAMLQEFLDLFIGFLKAHSSQRCSFLCSMCSSRSVQSAGVKCKGTRPQQMGGGTPLKPNFWLY